MISDIVNFSETAPGGNESLDSWDERREEAGEVRALAGDEGGLEEPAGLEAV